MITRVNNVGIDYKDNHKGTSDYAIELLAKAKTNDYLSDPAGFTEAITKIYTTITREGLLLSAIKNLKDNDYRKFDTYRTIVLDTMVNTLTTGTEGNYQMLYDLKTPPNARVEQYKVIINIPKNYPKKRDKELLYIINQLGLKETAFFMVLAHELLH